MEMTLDLSAVLDIDQEGFTIESYEAVKQLAFGNSESMNRFLELLHRLEEKTRSGEGNVAAQALKLGMCYLLLPSGDAAAEWLRKAEPGAYRSYFLGQAHLGRLRHGEAAAEFEQAAQAGWDKLECDCLKAECLVMTGDQEGAGRLIEQNAGAGESSAHWHNASGCLCQELGDLEGAIGHFERALECDDQYAPSMFRLACLLSLHGSDERALELYQDCSDLPVVHANALINLAVIYEDASDYDQAAQCLRRVLAVDPSSPRAQLYLKDVLAVQDMYIDEQEVLEQEKRSAVLDIPVTDFELSVRSRNCLKKMNIFTLGDLLRATESELLAYKNFGDTSLREIKAMLTQKSLVLGQYAELAAPPGEAGTTTPAPAAPEAEPDVMSRSVSTLKLSVRSRKCLQRLGIMTVGEILARTENELLESKNFGQTSLSEIKSRLAEINLFLKSPADLGPG